MSMPASVAPVSMERPGAERSRLAPHLATLADRSLSTFAPGEPVFAEEDRADCVYEVMGGVVRTLHFGRSGRRTVYGFFVPGEMFGFENRVVHRCSAEAVGAVIVARYERARLEREALADRTVATQLWEWLAGSSEQATARIDLLARGNALEKIAHFLREIARRTASGDRMRLPMSRYDIADYLGLSSETVSRTFTALRRQGVIATEGRSVSVLKPGALRQLDAGFD
ncbi:MAG TPA: helix-turn-helix domain-containing protein [Caulobacteraceae bacterium]